MRRVIAGIIGLAWVGLGASFGQEAFTTPDFDGPKPWTHLRAQNDPANFQFAVITDRTGGEREGKFVEGLRKLRLLQPEFVMSVGDLIEGYSEDEAAIYAQWDELQGMVENELEVPFFYVPGNHDITNLRMLEIWQERIGPPYYHFLYGDCLFLCLNTEDPPPKQVSDAQIAYVGEVLEAHPDVRWTFVFMHVPLWAYEHETRWEEIEAQLAGRRYTLFAGHTHDYMKTVRNDANHIVLATMGGGSQLRGPAYGEFDQIAWVTMRDDGPVVANLLLSGLWNENVRTAETDALVRPLLNGGAVRSAPVRSDDGAFTHGRTSVTFTNPGDRPLEMEAWLQPSHVLRVEPTHVALTVPPGGQASVDVTLFAEGELASAGVPPVRVDWRATYDVPDRGPLVVESAHRIFVERFHPVPARTAPVAVDGDLAEWESLPHRAYEPGQIQSAESSWSGPADASLRFATAYGETHLYLAVHVIDDVPKFRDLPQTWRKDGLEIRIDPRPGRESFVFRGPDDANEFLILGVSLDSTHEQTTVYPLDGLPEGVQAAAKAVANGYTVEVAVPHAYLDETQGEAWNAFRLNLTVYDYDAEYSAPRKALWWRPSWDTAESYDGSGMFRRN